MGENSKIEWTDHTFNPWLGCTKVSPACDHCYAAVSTAVRSTEARTGKKLWAGARHRTANWTGPVRWDREAAAEGKRARVFCASLADVFDNEVPPEWRVDLFTLIARTQNLDWLLLTKRIGNVVKMMEEVAAMLQRGNRAWRPLPNVWLGATICNQEEADRDIPKLLATPARVRFLSIEPMLGPVDLRDWLGSIHRTTTLRDGTAYRETVPGIDWVIVGGESGHHARPMHPDWARSIRDQCATAGVPFLFKQWGEWWPISQMPDGWLDQEQTAKFLPRRTVLQLDGTQENDFPLGAMTCFKVGKVLAGRALDGVTHDGFPEPA